MKSLAKIFFCGAAIFGMTVLFSSCTDTNEPEPGPEKPDMVGQSIFVPNEMNAEVTVSMEFEADDWTISNTNTWMGVYPYSGNAGVQEITVEVLGLNEELTERVAGFMVKDNGSNIQYYVIQDPVAGWDLSNKTAALSGDAQSYTFSVQGNLDFEAVVEDGADWLTIDGITETDSVLLADNSTYSSFRTYNISMSVTSNDGDLRTAKIALNGVDGTTSEVIEVSQFGEITDADWSKEFYKRSYLAKFSATWCGPCYTASNYIHQAMDQTPDRIELGQYMSSDRGGGLSEWAGGDSYYMYYIENRYFEGYIPAFDWNHYIAMESVQNASTWARLSDEAVEKVPAQTAIAGMVSLANDNMAISLSIASKVSADYNVSVFLLEDSLYTSCAGGSDYPNNDIIRAEFTETFGTPLTISANTVGTLTFTETVPAYIEDPNNLHVLVVVYREGSFSSSILPGYGCELGTIVDNVVDIPVNDIVLFKYEE